MGKTTVYRSAQLHSWKISLSSDLQNHTRVFLSLKSLPKNVELLWLIATRQGLLLHYCTASGTSQSVSSNDWAVVQKKKKVNSLYYLVSFLWWRNTADYRQLTWNPRYRLNTSENFAVTASYLWPFTWQSSHGFRLKKAYARLANTIGTWTKQDINRKAASG